MAEQPIIAYGEITILDLLDTATYIYYAEDENGTGAQSAPTSNTKYIGIYSGPSFEGGQPSTPPSGIIWSKYVGEDGASVTIKNTIVQYALSEDGTKKPQSGWQDNIPTVSQGFYLWTWTRVEYSNNKFTDSYSVSYSGMDGADGGAYYIESNCDDIVYFKTSSGIETSPKKLEISVYKMPYSENASKIDLTEKIKFGYFSNNDFISLLDENFSDNWNKPQQYYIQNIEGEYIEVTSKEILESTNDITYYVKSIILNEQGIEEEKYTNVGIQTADLKELIKKNKVSFVYDLKSMANMENFPLESLLKFAYVDENKEKAIKIFSYRAGTSEDMMKFNVAATSINAAIENSLMSFTEDGLKIYGAGLEIYGSKEDKNPALSAEEGNLYFTGELRGASGDFTGKITANSGEIGGFIIKDQMLRSIAIDENNNNVNLISLDGISGVIYARNITLGRNANIEEFIKLGNEGSAYIYNPDINDGIFLQSGENKKILLRNDGTANFGDIKINGETSEIYANYPGTEKLAWKLTPETAFFNNIVASGKIETAVFNTGSTQAVGGTMLFMPSYKIEKIENQGNKTEVTLDQGISGTKDQIVFLVVDNIYSEHKLVYDYTNNNKIVVEPSYNEGQQPIALIVVGQKDSLIMGINSRESSIVNNYIYGRGLTINKYGNTTGLPNLFLGDLTQLNSGNVNDYTGYGLYSDNVYLNGSLTTQVEESSYAGVNTLSGVKAVVFNTNFIETAEEQKEPDTSKIVFWAGATSKEDSAIQNAPFQVTENGSIYAARAKLTSSLFVGGEIKGADIYAARIHGWDSKGDKSPAALTIYDTNSGISFKTSSEDGEEETFSINASNFKAKGKPFILLEESNIILSGDLLKTNDEDNYLSLTTIDGCPVLYHGQGNNKCGFYFETQKTSYKINDVPKINFQQLGDTEIFGNFALSTEEEAAIKFRYVSAKGGYDLYVTAQQGE